MEVINQPRKLDHNRGVACSLGVEMPPQNIKSLIGLMHNHTHVFHEIMQDFEGDLLDLEDDGPDAVVEAFQHHQE